MWNSQPALELLLDDIDCLLIVERLRSLVIVSVRPFSSRSVTELKSLFLYSICCFSVER